MRAKGLIIGAINNLVLVMRHRETHCETVVIGLRRHRATMQIEGFILKKNVPVSFITLFNLALLLSC